VTVSASATDDALVPQWLAALRAVHIQATTAGVTVDPTGNATFTTSFDVPRSFR
jgi:hypothetical protein